MFRWGIIYIIALLIGLLFKIEFLFWNIANNIKIGIKYLPWTPLINDVSPDGEKYIYCINCVRINDEEKIKISKKLRCVNRNL